MTSRGDTLPETAKKTLCSIIQLSQVLPDSLLVCVYLKCLYGCKIYCCVLKGVQLVLSSVTKQSPSATPGQPTIIFTLTRQQMQCLSMAPSLSIQSVRQAREVEPTCYRTAKVVSTIHVFFLSRHLLDFFFVAMGLTRGQRRMDRVQGGE